MANAVFTDLPVLADVADDDVLAVQDVSAESTRAATVTQLRAAIAPEANDTDATIEPVGDAAAAGVSDAYARADHVHARPAPRAVRSEAAGFTVDGDDHDRPIEYTGTGAAAATFDSATAGQSGSIVLTGTAGTLTMTAGAGVTLLVEEEFTADTLAPSAGAAVTVSYQYLSATTVHVVGGLVAA